MMQTSSHANVLAGPSGERCDTDPRELAAAAVLPL